MRIRYLAFLIPGILLSILVACSGIPAPESPVSTWQFDGLTHQVVSGIAGDVPSFWVEHGWAGGGVLVYLADQEITCDDFPREVINGFPPSPVEYGATIWLKLTEKNTDAVLDYASFDVATIDSQGSGFSAGQGLDTARVGITALEEGRVRGWLEHAQVEDEHHRPLSVSGTFDVPFCG